MIRLLKATDVGSLAAIAKDAMTYPWSKQAFADSLAGSAIGWGLIQGNQMVGFAIVQYHQDEAELLNFAIAPAWRRQHLGSELLSWVVESAYQRHSRRLLLEVRASNHAAMGLFSQYDFQVISQRQGYYPAADNQREDALVMCLVRGLN